MGIGGPVGSGKTALTLQLCRALREKHSLAVVTNDIFTREDAEFLTRNAALPADRIAAVETGGCPHAAIREDVSANLEALEALTRAHPDAELLLCESGGDNLAAHFSNELADFSVYVIDVAGGDKVPRKGGPGITQADVLVVNSGQANDFYLGDGKGSWTKDTSSGGPGDPSQRRSSSGAVARTKAMARAPWPTRSTSATTSSRIADTSPGAARKTTGA